MPQSCTVCAHAERAAIEAAVRDPNRSASYHTLALAFGISKSSLLRHMEQHAERSAPARSDFDAELFDAELFDAELFDAELAPVDAVAVGQSAGGISIRQRAPSATIIAAADEAEDEAEGVGQTTDAEISAELVAEIAPSPAPAASPAAELAAAAAAALAAVRAALHSAQAREREAREAQAAAGAEASAAATELALAAEREETLQARLEEAQIAVEVTARAGAPAAELVIANTALEAAQQALEAAQEQTAAATEAQEQARHAWAASAHEHSAAVGQAASAVARLVRREAAATRVALQAHTAAGVERLAHLRAEHERLAGAYTEALHQLDVAAQDVWHFYTAGLAAQLAPWPELATRAASPQLADRAALLAPSVPLTTTRDLADAVCWLLNTVERHAGETVATIGGWSVLQLLDELGREHAQSAWRTIFAPGGRERAPFALRALRQAVAETLHHAP